MGKRVIDVMILNANVCIFYHQSNSIATGQWWVLNLERFARIDVFIYWRWCIVYTSNMLLWWCEILWCLHHNICHIICYDFDCLCGCCIVFVVFTLLSPYNCMSCQIKESERGYYGLLIRENDIWNFKTYNDEFPSIRTQAHIVTWTRQQQQTTKKIIEATNLWRARNERATFEPSWI